jgi:PKD repeat protein
VKGTLGSGADDYAGIYVSDGYYFYGYAFYGVLSSSWIKASGNVKQWPYLGDLTLNYCNTVYIVFQSSAGTPAGPGPRVDDFRLDYGPTATTSGHCQIVADRLTGQAPLTVSFQGVTDLTSGSYLWNFGDGSTSTARNPSHVYTTAGTYHVDFRASSGALTGFASATITVNPGVTCTYSLSTTSQSFGYAGGTGSVGVVAPSGCTWTTLSNAAWITVTSGASGSGNGNVGYSVAANSGSARSGTIAIADRVLTVYQDALSCSYSISPSSVSVGSTGGSGSFAVTANPGCPWTSTSDSSWLHITGGNSGSGAGTVSYSVDANGGGARTGHITVQGQIFTVTQASGAVTLSFRHWIAAASHTDGAGGSHWRSDVGVLNRSSSQATVEYHLYTPAGQVTQQVVLAGNAQDFHKDIAAWLGYTSGSGALEVWSDQDIFVMGRTYNQVDATHTYGQNYDGQEPDSSLLSAGQSAWLPLLAQNSGFRCNIAITNTGASTADVTLALYDGQGNLLWSGNNESSALASGGFIQYQTPFQKYAGRNDLEQAYAKVTVNSGSGIIVWASVVDNATGDPTTIFMKR